MVDLSFLSEMGPTGYARYGLYALQLLMSVIVWGATSNKLKSFSITDDIDVKVCYFGRGSNCGALIFFGVIITLALIGVIVAHVMGKLPLKIEALIFVVFAAIWALLAIISSAGAPSSGKTSAGNAVAVFSWFSIAAAVGSAAIAIIEDRQASGGESPDAEDK